MGDVEIEYEARTVKEVVVGREEAVGGVRVCFGEGREGGEL